MTPASTSADQAGVGLREAVQRAYDEGNRIAKGGWHNGTWEDRKFARSKRETTVDSIMQDLADHLGHEAVALATPPAAAETVGAGVEAEAMQAETYREMHRIATEELGYPSILEALEAAHPADHARPGREGDWHPIESAPKDGTIIWAAFHPRIFPDVRPQREDLERWNGVQVPVRHPGIVPGHDGQPFDMGWNVAAPVGNGGFPDEWIVGWRPLPIPPAALLASPTDADAGEGK